MNLLSSQTNRRTAPGHWLGCLLTALILVGCASPKPKEAAGEKGTPTGVAVLDERAFETVTFTNNIRAEWLNAPTNLFRLGPGDMIEIENLGQPEALGNVVLAGPDGKIYYSMLPGLSVWGLTLTETKELLENEWNRFTRLKPEFGITLRAVGSKRIWILGSVTTPGVYSMATPLTILEALSLAGGVRMTAGTSPSMPDLDNSFLMRNGEMLHLDLHRLISQGDLSQNIYLQPDDFIYLRNSVSREVTVLGAVTAPNVVPYHKRLTVLSAIATCGGTVAYANVSHVAVVRGSLTMPRVAVVDYRAVYNGRAPDVLLEPGDIVFVPLVAYAKVAALAEQMIGTLVRTIAANEGNRAVLENPAPIGVSVPGAGTIPGQ
jgi:protein involved in polysaccharide export with SLBB domain